MNLSLRLTCLVLSFVVTACATQPTSTAMPDLENPAVVKSLTKFATDPYTKGSAYAAPDLSPVQYKNLYLVAVLPAGKSWVYQVYVRDQYRETWRFYDRAFDIDGTQLAFTSLERETDDCRYSCGFYENMVVTVSRQYLDQRRTRGLNFKILGSKGGERIVVIPPGYLAGFLDATQSIVGASASSQQASPSSGNSKAVGATAPNTPSEKLVGKRFDPSKVDTFTPGSTTIQEARNLLGTATAESAMANGATLLQWQYVAGSLTGASSAHVAILFDQSGKMIRVTHKFVQ